MIKVTIEFIDRWNTRLAKIKGDSLIVIFQRFEALYVLHNLLYNESFRVLNDSNSLPKTLYADYEKASLSLLKIYQQTLSLGG